MPRRKVYMYPAKKRRDSRNGNYMPRGGDAWPVQLQQEMASQFTCIRTQASTRLPDSFQVSSRNKNEMYFLNQQDVSVAMNHNTDPV